MSAPRIAAAVLAVALAGCDTGKHHGLDKGEVQWGTMRLHFEGALKQNVSDPEKALWAEWLRIVSDTVQAETGLTPTETHIHVFQGPSELVVFSLGPNGPGLYAGVTFERAQGQLLGGSFDRYGFVWRGEIYLTQGPRQQVDGYGCHATTHVWLEANNVSPDPSHTRPEWAAWTVVYQSRMLNLWASR